MLKVFDPAALALLGGRLVGRDGGRDGYDVV
jgi:hypothetical protein